MSAADVSTDDRLKKIEQQLESLRALVEELRDILIERRVDAAAILPVTEKLPGQCAPMVFLKVDEELAGDRTCLVPCIAEQSESFHFCFIRRQVATDFFVGIGLSFSIEWDRNVFVSTWNSAIRCSV